MATRKPPKPPRSKTPTPPKATSAKRPLTGTLTRAAGRAATIATTQPSTPAPAVVTTYRLVAVVENVDRETAHEIGVERAYHAIKYVEVSALRMKPDVFVRPDRKLLIGSKTYELRTISTRVLAAAVDAIRKGVPLEPPPQLEKTTRAIAQRLDNLGIEAIRVTSHYRGGESEVLRLPLAEARKLFDRLGP